jgi:hypothetical protein
MISTRILTRVVIGLIALWSLAAGLMLVAFQGSASSGALGAGLSDFAGQRLVGAHLLVLVPVYLLLIWRTDRYRGLLWLPFAAQLAVVLSIGSSILEGHSDFEDGILALAVSTIFAALFAFVWVSEVRSVAREDWEEAASGAAEPSRLGEE